MSIIDKPSEKVAAIDLSKLTRDDLQQLAWTCISRASALEHANRRELNGPFVGQCFRKVDQGVTTYAYITALSEEGYLRGWEFKLMEDWCEFRRHGFNLVDIEDDRKGWEPVSREAFAAAFREAIKRVEVIADESVPEHHLPESTS